MPVSTFDGLTTLLKALIYHTILYYQNVNARNWSVEQSLWGSSPTRKCSYAENSPVNGLPSEIWPTIEVLGNISSEKSRNEETLIIHNLDFSSLGTYSEEFCEQKSMQQ
jgi:hypothetical protein